jgi:hypothetical protein
MFISHHQNARKTHNKKIANRSSKNMAKFKYMGMTVTNQNLILEEIRAD